MSSSNKVHLSLKNAIMFLNVSNRNARNFLGLKKAPCKTDPSKKYKLQGLFFFFFWKCGNGSKYCLLISLKSPNKNIRESRIKIKQKLKR